jgi:CBS domain-containing protein
MADQLMPAHEARWTAVTVQDAMRPGVVTCRPEDRVTKLAATMVAGGVHALVVGPLERPAPLIVTDRTLVRAALEERAGARAADVAHEPVATVPGDAAFDDAVALMAEHYVAHLIVIDPESGTPSGVVSSFDAAAVLGGYEPRIARMLRPGPARPSPSAVTLAEAVVKDVMHPAVVTCPPGASLATVARTMAEHRVHCVAVAGVDNGAGRSDHLTWGLIEDMDLVLAMHRRALAEPAAAIASSSPVAVAEEDVMERAARLMIEHDTGHVVVVGRSGLPSGMLSTHDVARIVGAGAL